MFSHPPLVLSAADRRAGAIAAAAVLGFALVAITFWPGWLSPDSVYQFEQARGLTPFTDQHPPAMAAVWRLLDHVVPGPGGMLLLQNALFWGGLALASWVWVDGWVAPLVVLAVGWFPTSLSHLGTIIKDVQMGAAFVAAFGLLSLAHARGSRAALAGSLAAIFYACLMRHNAVVTAWPLLGWWAWLALGRPRAAWLRLASLALALPVALGALTIAVDRTITDGRTTHNEQASFVYDLAAFSLAANENLMPAELRNGPQDVPLDRIKSLFLPDCSVLLYYPPTPGPHFDIYATTPEQLRAIEHTWWRLVRERPGTYLRHRWSVFSHLLGIHRPTVCYPFEVEDVQKSRGAAELGIRFEPSRWTQAVYAFLWRIRDGRLFRAWRYLLAIVAMVGVALWRRSLGMAALALAASALANVAPYFVFAPDCGFRYSWWTVVAALLLPAVLWGRRGARGAATGQTS